MNSTMDVEIDCLAEIVGQLKMFDIKVTGSKEANGMVCLAIEGPIVPDAPKVMVGSQLTIKGKIAMITASCDVVPQ